GNLKTNGSIRIDGSVQGDIEVKESLFAGKGSLIKGNINCKSAVIGGKIEGNIIASELLEFQSGAQITGDITCRGLIIQSGVIFDGTCQMSQKSKEKG
ncbi:MAG: polymer-forming cytoskeletal protein, partial [candidate division WOR-3 bacterium]